MNVLVKYFLRGLLYIIPLSLTIWIFFFLVKYVGQMMTPIVNEVNKFIDLDLNWLSTVLAVIIICVLVIIIGYLGSILISTPINTIFKKILKKAPLVQTIYTSIKDLMQTFVGDKKGFSEPVLVKVYENSTIERIGFVTSEDIKSLNIKDGKVLVYMPHSYAISGQLFVVDKKDVKRIDCSASEVMKLVVSGGVTEIEK
tara:strand:+ start:282 stop:878 length:597 start_codon:yes stop_codon:yes gene_type:complete